jgi:hypothetical protein
VHRKFASQKPNFIVFREKITGTTADRPQLRKLMGLLTHGDVVLIPAVDRLSRDATDLLVIARDMQRAGAGLRSKTSDSLAGLWCYIPAFGHRAVKAHAGCGERRFPGIDASESARRKAENHSNREKGFHRARAVACVARATRFSRKAPASFGRGI